MKNILFLSIYTFLSFNVFGQIEEPDTDIPAIRIRQNGLYGKLLDKNTGKPIEAASVQLYAGNADSLLAGMLTKANGNFIFTDIPQADSFRLVISALGYETWTQTISAATNPGNREKFRKDLGNISLNQQVQQLGGVTVTASRPALEMGIDRRIFNVDKSLVSAGGTAIDVMKNIPSVTVDIDGNVQLRNNSPQIFVDGRPTILTLDQIPADNIEKIELITNPSAKFDAASSGGIINVVLKKNKRVGLNGIATLSGGTPKLFSSNLNVNLRQGKFNFFTNGGYNQSGGKARGQTLRENRENGVATDYFNQFARNERSREFSSVRFGFDYFIDNRNTITLSQDFFKGRSGNEEIQDQEYLNSNKVPEYYGKRSSEGRSVFNRRSSRMNYKHTFPLEGRELTADVIYNSGDRSDGSTIRNTYFFPDGSQYEPPAQVLNDGSSNEEQLTFQSDFVNPLKENIKIETGIRSYHNKNRSFYNVFANDNGQQVKLPLSNNYEYREMVNALYFTFSVEKEKYSYQLGLRAEHSKFTGLLVDSAYKFGYEYPNKIDRIWDALFPSVFYTKKLGEDDEIQVNYTRRIRRPRFMQLNPFIEINDPVNLQQGNPQLRPEFMNSFELNYSNAYKNGSFLGVLYFRNNPDDITQYSDTITAAQYQQLDNAAVDPNAILNTFINASTTNHYGAEFTLQHKLARNFDITPTVELEYRTVNANVKGLDLSNKGFNWEAKLIANYKIETNRASFFNNFSFQLMGEYESAEVIPQGKQIPQYTADFAIRKDFLKNNKATFTFAVNDIFNTRRWGTIYDTDQFYQDSYRRQNVRNFRLSFSYKFGDADFSLSRRDRGNDDDDE
jgi:outer membrane receptor protein involved in Fe transport